MIEDQIAVAKTSFVVVKTTERAAAYTNLQYGNYNDLLDVFLTYRPDGDRWKVTGFVSNRENSEVLRDAEESQYRGPTGFGSSTLR
jgi:hypothetical protein